MAEPSSEGRRAEIHTPLIEVNVSHEHGPSPDPRRLTQAIEIVTRNHTYVLDSTLRCIEVRSASSREPVADSAFVGARLVGGQRNTEEATELSYPFPRPGAEGVFEVVKGRARQFHKTSPVLRVVLRLSILTVTRTRAMPTWEQISQAVHTDDPPTST